MTNTWSRQSDFIQSQMLLFILICFLFQTYNAYLPLYAQKKIYLLAVVYIYLNLFVSKGNSNIHFPIWIESTALKAFFQYVTCLYFYVNYHFIPKKQFYPSALFDYDILAMMFSFFFFQGPLLIFITFFVFIKNHLY